MSETITHTPGPWGLQGDQTQQAHYVAGADGNPICDMHKPAGFYRAPQETEANANLIAAAPALLAACEAMLHDMAAYDMAQKGFTDCMSRARAAIAKAKGKQ